jgi:hypothetical protein
MRIISFDPGGTNRLNDMEQRNQVTVNQEMGPGVNLLSPEMLHFILQIVEKLA